MAVTQRPGEEIKRITVTPPLLNRASLVVFLVTGAEKATVLQEVLEESPEPHRRPARLVRPANGTVRWLVDRAAARLLRPGL